MLQIALIFVWIAFGLAVRRAGAPSRAFAALNKFIIWVPLPATVLIALHGLHWESSYWVPVSMAWIVFGGSVIFFAVVGRRLGWSSRTIGALVMTAGLGNTSFLGFPLLRALYGEGAIPVAVLTDQPGSFLVLSTLGIIAASCFSSGRASVSAVLGRMAKFPPLWALILAVLLRPIPFSADVEVVLRFGMRTLIPLALISVGGALRFDRKILAREQVPVTAGLMYKLILAPAAMALLLVAAFHQRGQATRITLLEAAMGPMITGAIVAEEYGLDGELCSLMVGLGVPLCLVTVPMWAKLLSLVSL
ncbi:MAG: AEC family transporter [Elusimicrobia bacterium]|nr:AEC family transporter [Elusimicrobiota bacterium]